MNKLKVCLIGFEEGQMEVYSALAKDPRIEISSGAVFSVKDREECEKIGIRYYYDLEEMLRIEKPDFVSVFLKTDEKTKIMQKIAEFKVSILYNEPIADELEEAEKVSQLVRQHGVLCVPASDVFFNPSIVFLREQIFENALGLPVSAFCRRFIRRGKRGNLATLYMPFIHLTRLLMNSEIKYVYSSTTPDESFGVMNLGLKNDTTATIAVGFNEVSAYPIDEVTIDVIGTDGAVLIRPNHASIRIYSNRGVSWDYWDKSGIDSLIEHFINLVLGMEQKIIDINDELVAIKVIDAARRSAQSKTVVELFLKKTNHHKARVKR